MSADDWIAVRLTAQLAALATALLLIVGTPVAWWLARTRSAAQPLVAALVTMPLVLPPTVMGFYLLLLMGPQGPVGQLTQALGLGRLPFTFAGLVVASVLYSMPFVVQPLQQAFEAIPVVLMIGGNIPGATRVLSVAIYGHVEALEFDAAHRLAAGMVLFALVVLLALYLIGRPTGRAAEPRR